jgi:hypothetical protein
VFLGLTSTGKAGFKFTRHSIDHQDARVCICGTGNHDGNKVGMSWSIQNDDLVAVGGKRLGSNFHGYSPGSFRFVFIQQPGELYTTPKRLSLADLARLY